MALKRGRESLRIECGDQWWDPTPDIHSMELDQANLGAHTLTLTMWSHRMPDLPYMVDLRVRFSWDNEHYWSGNARLAAHEVTGDHHPMQTITLLGTFVRETAVATSRWR